MKKHFKLAKQRILSEGPVPQLHNKDSRATVLGPMHPGAMGKDPMDPGPNGPRSPGPGPRPGPGPGPLHGFGRQTSHFCYNRLYKRSPHPESEGTKTFFYKLSF